MKSPRRLTAVCACLGLALAGAAYGQTAAPVEDRYATGNVSNNPRLADLFYQMQQMQQEIMELRGQLEEQAYRIKRLEQQRLEDYQNLDRRLQQGGSSRSSSSYTSKSSSSASKAATAGAATAGAAAASSSKSTKSSSSATKSKSQLEREAYQQAFQLLKKQKLKEAELAFKDYLADYPDGQYASNSYYWLGELYLTADNQAQARKTFSTLVQRYPDYRKTPDATFKLARIYYQEGDKAKAEELLNKIVRDYGQTSPSTVKMANSYLDKYFR